MRWGLVTDVAKHAAVPVAEADEVDVEAVTHGIGKKRKKKETKNKK